jgi:antitoxin component of MazEF toxin-antitoxin module
MLPTLQATLSTWGKSVAIRIPAELLRSSGWQAGQTVQFEPAANGAIMLRSKPKKLNLEDLLAQCDWTQAPGAEDHEWLDSPAIGEELL